MATAADIGANASNYTGNAGLGGGSFGAFNLDLRPIEDLARYTMLYNKAEYDQRQKDAEKAADQIAALTSYDLTSGIPKDAKHLQQRYDALTEFVRNNPGAIDYRNKEEFLKYNRMKNDLANDIASGQKRNSMWALRQQKIQEQTDPELRKLMQEELDAEIEATDIRTPIKHDQQYDDYSIKLPEPGELSFDVMKQGPNEVVSREFKLFNVAKARMNGDMFSLGLDSDIDPNTPEGKRQLLERKNNPWLRGAEAVNATINAQDASGNYLYKTKHTDANGNVTWTLDESKMGKLPRDIISLVKQTNAYLKEVREDIASGAYTDKFSSNKLSFGDGALDVADYADINYEDGISPEELALVAQYANWKGDSHGTKFQQTDNALQASAQAETARHNKASEGIAWANVENERERIKIAKGLGVNLSGATTGNAFDEIGAVQEIPLSTGGRISNGIFYTPDGKGVYTGAFNMHRSMLPTNMIAALKAAGVNVDYYKVDKDGNSIDNPIKVVVSKGVIQSITDANGRDISRQAMENAQKRYDTERKGLPPLEWGVNASTFGKPLQAPQATQQTPSATTTSSGLPIIK